MWKLSSGDTSKILRFLNEHFFERSQSLTDRSLQKSWSSPINEVKSRLFSPISVVSRKSLNHINTEKASSQFVFAFHETTHRHVTMLGMQKLIISEEVNWTWQKIPRSSASHNTDAGLCLAGAQFTPDSTNNVKWLRKVVLLHDVEQQKVYCFICATSPPKKNLQTTQQKVHFCFAFSFLTHTFQTMVRLLFWRAVVLSS